MGLYKRDNGVFYLSLTINKKRIYKSLQTKNKQLADELYAIYLKETFLKSLQSTESQKMSQITDTPKQKILSIEKTYLEYLKYSESQGNGHRVIEDKKRLLKRLKVNGFIGFDFLTCENVDQLWIELGKDLKDASLRKMIVAVKRAYPLE